MEKGERCDWVQLQKYVQSTTLLIDQGESYAEKSQTIRLIGQLKTAAKDLLFQRLQRLRLVKSPVLSEISRSVFCPSSPDASRQLTELIFTIRSTPSVFQTLLSLWPKESKGYQPAIACFSSLFFTDFLSPFSQDWELLRVIQLSIDIGEHLVTEDLVDHYSPLGYLLRTYRGKREVAQYLRAVYERPALEILYNIKVKMEVEAEEIEGKLRIFREKFEGDRDKIRSSEPISVPPPPSSDPFNPNSSTLPAFTSSFITRSSVKDVLIDVASSLQAATEMVLSSLMNTVHTAPYGVRYIAREMYENGRKMDLKEAEIASLIGFWLFPGWENGVFEAIEAVPTDALSKMTKGNLRIVEKTIRHVFSNTPFSIPEYNFLNDFISIQQ